jgi:DNA-binding response OmpR family regulator
MLDAYPATEPPGGELQPSQRVDRHRVRHVDCRDVANELIRGNVHLDFAGRRARVDGKEVPLTAREWSIVELLESRAGRVVPRDDILDSVGGEQSAAGQASLEVLVGRIRKKLGAEFIRTIRGRGYSVG